MEKLTSLQAILRYCETRGIRPVPVEELRKLAPEQRERLGEACARMLGVERVQKPPQ